MRELLLSKGFIFNDYEYNTGNFYEYEENDNERIGKIFGFINCDYSDLLLCCDEYFTEFEAYCDGVENHYTKEEFTKLVEQM